jgi:hypothetical protein
VDLQVSFGKGEKVRYILLPSGRHALLLLSHLPCPFFLACSSADTSHPSVLVKCVPNTFDRKASKRDSEVQLGYQSDALV